MIAKTYILESLRHLDHKFNHSKTNKEAIFFAKMAIIELAGWTEEAMDGIHLGCSRRVLRDQANRKEFEEAVRRNSGFHYAKNFRPLLIQLVGIMNVEIVEKNVDQVKLSILKTELGQLTKERNEEAHTHIRHLKTINAPSKTRANYHKIYEGLVEIDVLLKKMGL